MLRDKKLALPLAPNRLPALPLPNAAPMSAPFAMLDQDQADHAQGVSICTARMMFTIAFMLG